MQMIEAKAFAEQSTVRSEVARDKRLKKQETPDLFPPDVLQSRYDTDLLNRYHKQARAAVEGCLRKQRRVSYDQAEELALSFTLTASTHLKEWIADWKRAGAITVEGLAPKQRIPRPRSGHFLIWQ